ncbi:hypothetical protein RDABS01_035155, partial [Bienertia sinuspersici]
MNDLVDLGGWKTDNGQFKNAKPHIESQVKLLRKQYDAISKILSPSASGFGWNDDGKFVTCPQCIWDEWIKSHKNAAGLKNKPFPLFDDLGKIFGKDREVGNEAEHVFDILEDMEEEERGGEELQAPHYDVEETRPPPSTTRSTKTKRARTEKIEALKEFSTKLAKISDVMEGASEHIKRLANCFQHESNSAERRMEVTGEIMKMEGLTPNEVIMVSKKIALNPL